MKAKQTWNWKECFKPITPAIGWIGVAIAWCLQTGYGTPYLLGLGLKESNVNYVWLAGPVTGMIAQPIVGSYSDKIQTRKPFIIIGSIVVFMTLIIFSNAQFISNKYGLIIAVITFWINDFFISVLMAPIRVLASDTISSSKQIDAMSWFSIFGSLGAMIAFGIGGFISDVSILYFIGALFVLCTSSITLICTAVTTDTSSDHGKLDNHQIKKKDLCWNGFIDIFIGIKNCPLFLWKLMLTQFFAFAAFLPLWIYVTHFYGENIMKGQVTANINSKQFKLYQQGVKYGNLAFCLHNIVVMICSYLIGKYFIDIKNKKVIKIFWIVSYGVYGIFGCIAPWINNLILFITLHSFCGISMASMHIFPWSFASKYAIDYDPQNAGLLLTILNISVCIPQIFVALIGGLIIQHFNNNVSSILFFGGILGFVAAISVCFVDIEYKGTKLKYNYSTLQQMDHSINIIEMEEHHCTDDKHYVSETNK